MVKSELYQLSPAPVTTLPTPLRAARVERVVIVVLEFGGGMMGWAPWAPWVPPVVIVYELSVGNVGGPVGAEEVRRRNGMRRAS